ncbi:patatin-like phospholipase family protein [Candidatus Thiothrix sp. Deng01]|uniref:Patatin-like phospholipase family protein n=1 Tax=Candidatus Thiothrix phosphatis TaxID=3112415 RepID=A0ABU6CVV0_9GAMM|nr:patatin-like phospholipase family protein [Candidatus Thiothrix sp. Deng01]MEB4590706.1 patatin-like phospholipase family protein [Candidatus Thiothrix sp. Deng01]
MIFPIKRAGGRGLALLLLAFSLSACVSIPRDYSAPSAQHYEQAEIAGYRHIRFWGDMPPPDMNRLLARQHAALQTNPELARRFDVLALSGGGEDGAYGAGFLKGWSKRGDRPRFTLVTGVSTGALIAPFAFLGPKYDDAIQRFYTATSRRDIFLLTPLKILFGGSAIGDTAPLKRLLHEEVNDRLVAEIAAESRQGRVLLIGTTDLDAERPVIWNIGRIADSGRPDAAKLIANIMLASASVPGAFPPVRFDVLIHGQRHQEVHVDGGVTNQIFVYPPSLDMRVVEQRLGLNPHKTFWLIRNTKVDPEYDAVGLGVASITKRAIQSLIKYQGRSNLVELEKLAERDGFDLRLTYVPQDFKTPLTKPFDPVYMRDLYQVGYHAALSAQPWHARIDAVEQAAPAVPAAKGVSQ